MAAPRQIFDFFIEPIRSSDKREGHDFLKRWLMGPQEIWETHISKAADLRKLWSPAECPDNAVRYLAWIVGWTSQLDYIVNELTLEELRRLISVSVKLWKERGTEPALVDVLYLATGARCRALNWFDFRWILGEDYIGEEWGGLDSWLISLPGEDARAEYLSNLRIVDNGNLNRRLVENLVELMRALGENWEITYLVFLDLFTESGDLAQWDLTASPSAEVTNGTLVLNSGESIQPISPIDVRAASCYF
jgi:phage tail-like protein